MAGESVGTVEIRLPIAEKQMADIHILKIRSVGMTIPEPKITIPMNRGSMETNIPYKNPARISPKIIAGMDAGVETRRSRVLPKVSQGAIMGVDEEEIKNSVIPSRPGNRL